MAIGLSHEEAPPREAEPDSSPRRRHPVILTVVVVIIVLLAALIGWIALRAYLARQQLYAALPAANAVIDGIRGGNLEEARSGSADLKKHAAEAASLTSDPVWRAAEVLPWAGENLRAVRTIAAATDSVASDVVQPLVTVAGQADPRSIHVSGGAIALAPLVAAQPAVEHAQAAFHRAQDAVSGIRDANVIAPVRSAVERLDDLFGQAAPTVDAIGNTARLLPGMLGASGQRNYLLVAQNPAELRATGGLIGSVALLRADHGHIALVTQAAGTSIGPWDTPVADIPPATQGIFGPLVGRFLQDVNYTPDFPLAASTAATMWERQHGGRIDGVITMDPVVLSALLKATGPVALPDGSTMTSDNAVQLLLSEVYQRYPGGDQQDAFFASAAAAVFAKLAAGGVDGSGLVSALAAAGTSDRLLIWSADAGEQKVLASTTLAGTLPVSTADTAALGVYFNDATGSKMDYYLSTSVAAGAAVCRADGKPTSLVKVTLTSRAPADAGTALPEYVTGGGHFGVAPGDILTRVVVYGPSGGLLAGVTADGKPYSSVSGTDRARPVAVADVLLKPGESKTVEVEFLNVEQTGTGLTVATTPTLPGDGSTPDVGTRPAVGTVAVGCSTGVK